MCKAFRCENKSSEGERRRRGHGNTQDGLLVRSSGRTLFPWHLTVALIRAGGPDPRVPTPRTPCFPFMTPENL